MAKRRKGRPVNGIVLLDKPYTTFLQTNALQKARSTFISPKKQGIQEL